MAGEATELNSQFGSVDIREGHDFNTKGTTPYFDGDGRHLATAVSAWSALAAGKNEEVLRHMELAANMEDGTEKSAVTPGPLSPALEMNKPAKALVQFEASLKKETRRFRSLYGAAHAAQLSGSSDLSQKYFGELLTVCAHSDKPGRPEIKAARDSLAKQKS